MTNDNIGEKSLLVKLVNRNRVIQKRSIFIVSSYFILIKNFSVPSMHLRKNEQVTVFLQNYCEDYIFGDKYFQSNFRQILRDRIFFVFSFGGRSFQVQKAFAI